MFFHEWSKHAKKKTTSLSQCTYQLSERLENKFSHNDAPYAITLEKHHNSGSTLGSNLLTNKAVYFGNEIATMDLDIDVNKKKKKKNCNQ